MKIRSVNRNLRKSLPRSGPDGLIHSGGAVVTGTAIFCLLLAGIFLCPGLAAADPVPVRFSEGIARGFLVLSDSKGERIATGDFFQVGRGMEVTSRTVFHFKDGSLHDETVVFTQQRSFTLESYHLVQKGPAFEKEMDISLDRTTGNYLVKVKGPDEAKEKLLEGTINLPLDAYNGMIPIIVKNLAKGARETVHMVGFTPTPRVVGLEMVPAEEEKVMVGDLEKSVLHYILKPRLGLLKIPAVLFGLMPPNNHVWVVTDEVPAFVRFVGPLAGDGPIWRIDLASPVWSK